MITPKRDPHANAKWLAAELDRIGYGAQSDLARHLDLPPSAISNILAFKRKISAEEFEAIQDFVDEKLADSQRQRLSKPRRKSTIAKVPVVGYVAAGATEYRYALSQGDLDEVEAPAGVTDRTVAVQIRGNSLGDLFDRWYAFYDDVRTPITDDLIGALCVVGLTDDRVLIKKVLLGQRAGSYNLVSPNDKPIRDVKIAWAARVKGIGAR